MIKLIEALLSMCVHIDIISWTRIGWESNFKLLCLKKCVIQERKLQPYSSNIVKFMRSKNPGDSNIIISGGEKLMEYCAVMTMIVIGWMRIWRYLEAKPLWTFCQTPVQDQPTGWIRMRSHLCFPLLHQTLEKQDQGQNSYQN